MPAGNCAFGISYQAYLLMGRAYAKMPRTDDAVKALRTSGELNPPGGTCYFQLALVLPRSGTYPTRSVYSGKSFASIQRTLQLTISLASY